MKQQEKQQYRFDPALYPRTYRFNRTSMILSLTATFLCLLAAVIAYIYMISDFPETILQKQNAPLLIGTFLFVGAFVLFHNFGTWIRLHPDSIQYSFFYFTKTIPRTDLALCRSKTVTGKQKNYIAPFSSGRMILRTLESMKRTMGSDDALESWCMTLPDYEEELERKRREFSAQQHSWGVTPEARYKTYKILKLALQHIPFTVIVVIIFSGVLIDDLNPQHFPSFLPGYALCLYLMPLVAAVIYLSNPRAFTFTPSITDKIKISLDSLFIFPGFLAGYWFVGILPKEGLWLNVFEEYWFKNPFFMGPFLALFLLPFLLEVRHHRNWYYNLRILFFYLLFSASSAVGIMASYNVLFDKSKPITLETQVVRIVQPDRPNKADQKRREITITPIDGKNRRDPFVNVSYELYDRVQPGEKICHYAYPGAAGIRWEKYDYCPGKK